MSIHEDLKATNDIQNYFFKLLAFFENHAAITLALSTGFLFFEGFIFTNSYLIKLGLDDSQFPPSPQQLIFLGFFSSIQTAAYLLTPWLLFGFTAWLFGEFYSRLARKFPSILESLTLSPARSHKLNRLTAKSWFRYVVFPSIICPLGIGITLLLIAMLSLFADYAAEQRVENFIKRCNEIPSAKTDIYFKTDAREKSISGCSIMCNSSECAFLVDKKSMIIDRQGRVISEKNINTEH